MTNPDRADIKSLNGASNTVNRGMPIIAFQQQLEQQQRLQ